MLTGKEKMAAFIASVAIVATLALCFSNTIVSALKPLCSILGR